MSKFVKGLSGDEANLYSCYYSKHGYSTQNVIIYIMRVQVLTPEVKLEEYSVILTTSFNDITQKILRKKGYFQNFS